MNDLKIDVWSDVVCPWCYIGVRRLASALADLAELRDAPRVELTYRSFQLMPDMPTDFDGDYGELLSGRAGLDRDQSTQMMRHIKAVAAKEGLDFSIDRAIPANTGKAHQLLHLAKAHGRQAEMKERLLAAHFTETRHVGRVEELADLAADVGLDRAETIRSLDENRYSDAVRTDIDQARRYGITGVPFFVLNGIYGISGAQEPTVFLRALTRAAQEPGAVA